MDFAILADHRVKLKESEKRYKYQDLARELKKTTTMKLMAIPIVTGAFGSVTKGLAQRLEDLEKKKRGRGETIETTALLRWDRILRRVQET